MHMPFVSKILTNFLKKKIVIICSCDRLLLFTDIYYPVPFSLKGNFLTLGMLILPMAFFGQWDLSGLEMCHNNQKL